MGKTADYYGESSRTAYQRGQEHLGGQTKKLDDNPFNKHDFIHHGGHKGAYSMVVLRSHKHPLSRQIQEATEIQCSKFSIIMNNKSEWNSQKIPRITIEVGDRIITEEYRGTTTTTIQDMIDRTNDQAESQDTETMDIKEKQRNILNWEASIRKTARQEVTAPIKRQDHMDPSTDHNNEGQRLHKRARIQDNTNPHRTHDKSTQDITITYSTDKLTIGQLTPPLLHSPIICNLNVNNRQKDEAEYMDLGDNNRDSQDIQSKGHMIDNH